MTRRFGLRPLLLVPSLVLAVSVASSSAAAAATSSNERSMLVGWARDTWASFVAMTNPGTGLTSDNVTSDGVVAGYTSPTNVAMYLWAVVGARDIGIITPTDARTRIAETFTTLERMERSHGQFFNWYDPATGKRLETWPTDGHRVAAFLSTVDNGWLASAFMVVRNAVPQLRDRAEALLDPMDFGLYYDERVGQLFGGAWTQRQDACNPERDGLFFTCFNYGTLNTEPRIASYIGIARGQLPREHYFHLFRTFEPTCDWGWQEQQPQGDHRTYLGVSLFEGTYGYRGMRLVPSWGGSMFEALMVPLLVPEETWGAKSWGVNHPLYVRSQIEHGLDEARYGYWGFSPSDDPAGGYREYGVDPIGLNPDGYTSDEQRTTVDLGFGDCRPAQPPPSAYGDGVVTPHASFIALRYARSAAIANLTKLRADFDAYGKLGFYDAVNVTTGQVAHAYLALDQGMIMAALTNALTDDQLRAWFTRGEIRDAIRPLLGIERFDSGPGG